MTPTRSVTLWTAYYMLYFGGFIVAIHQTHTVGAGSVAMWLPFALPPLLVWVAAMADRAEAREPPRPSSAQVSVVTGEPPFRRDPPRTISAVAMGMVTPFTNWVFPEHTSSAVKLAFMIVMLACAWFTAVVIPRLQPRPE